MKKLIYLIVICVMAVSCSGKKVADLKTGEDLHGFKLLQKDFVKNQGAIVYLFEHIKTGAILVNMENDDINRVFSITFNTYPHDNIGMPHILEHSVLAGSRNYPSKGTFEELKKGSFTTYLNAFTQSDSTSYPVATTNAKEFKNLMSVYLDAVFYPNIYRDPMILKQEGVRVSYDKKKDKLHYVGVVFNEMKGVMGKPGRLMMTTAMNALLPNSTYSYESGGDPLSITDLDSKEVLKFHTLHYHPSNSYTWIYGKDDISEKLKFINEQYFSKFEKKAIVKENIGLKTIDGPTRVTKKYSIPENSPKQGKYYATLNFVTGDSSNTELDLSFKVLSALLTKTQTSPLSKALIDAKVGNEVYTYHSAHLPWKTFNIAVEKTNAGKAPLLKSVSLKALKNIAKKGFDKDYIEGTLRSFEFSFREFDTGYTPKGIILARTVNHALKFNLDPFHQLNRIKELERVKKLAKTSRYFEKMIEKYILNNDRFLQVELIPSPGLAKKEEAILNKKIEAMARSLGKEGVEKLKEESIEFAKYQNTPSKKEDIAKIPFISISDIENKQEVTPQEKFALEGATILYHPLFTKGINYVTLNFSAETVPEELIPYANLILSLLENLKTEKYTLTELQSSKSMHTGFAYNAAPVFEDYKKDLIYPKFQYRIGTLSENLPKSLEFIKEVVLNTQYDDYKSLQHFLKSIQINEERSIMGSTSGLPVKEISSNISRSGSYKQKLKGLNYYWMIRDINKNFEGKKKEVAAKLKKTARLIFTKKNLIIGVTATEEEKEQIKKSLAAFIKALPGQEGEVQNFNFAPSKKNTALVVPGKVQYVAMGGSLVEKGARPNGNLNVLMQVLKNEFLHPEIRQKNGAYGAYAWTDLKGNLTMLSYRDPNLQKTLDVYKKVPNFVEQITLSDDDLQKYIIGTIKEFDTPKTNKQKGSSMMGRFIMNYTLDDRQKIRADVLATTVKKMKSYAPKFTEIIKNNLISVAGTKVKIDESKEEFNEIITVLE